MLTVSPLLKEPLTSEPLCLLCYCATRKNIICGQKAGQSEQCVRFHKKDCIGVSQGQVIIFYNEVPCLLTAKTLFYSIESESLTILAAAEEIASAHVCTPRLSYSAGGGKRMRSRRNYQLQGGLKTTGTNPRPSDILKTIDDWCLLQSWLTLFARRTVRDSTNLCPDSLSLASDAPVHTLVRLA